MKAPLPQDEAGRRAALKRYRVLDTPPEAAFDDLTSLASQLCSTPIALISLVDGERQWFKSKIGIDTAEAARNETFCAHTILRADEVMEIPDAQTDPRFANSELVTSPPHIRFYAGAPLVTADGYAVGALCVMDKTSRKLSPEQVAGLKALSRNVVAQLEARQHTRDLTKEVSERERVEAALLHRNQRLAESEQETKRLLALAEKSRGALLSVLEDQKRDSVDLSRSNRALKMLSGCNEAVIRAEDEASLLKEVCRIAVESGGYGMAWVGYAQHDEAKSIRWMAHAGDEGGYLADITLSWAESNPRGRGPAGRVVRSGQPIFCEDIRQDPTFYLKEAAEQRGFRSVVCLPLREGVRTFGLLSLDSVEVRKVSADEIKLLQQLADDLAFGIGAIHSRLERQRAEAALLTSLNEKEALLREVHHRVKNNLQVIASLLRLESRRIDHPATQTVLRDMQSRIQSMALLHETIYRSGNFAHVNAATYLQQLATQVVRSQVSSPGIALETDIDPVGLEIDQAIPCGLIVNELASNSLKHGFPAGHPGVVRIELKSAGDQGAIRLRVSDTGVGLPEGFEPNRKGTLGLQLVADLARQLRGEFEIGPGPEAVFAVTFTPATSEPFVDAPHGPR